MIKRPTGHTKFMLCGVPTLLGDNPARMSQSYWQASLKPCHRTLINRHKINSHNPNSQFSNPSPNQYTLTHPCQTALSRPVPAAASV
jgi:hypothetical protein